jgi:hypothetical protein
MPHVDNRENKREILESISINVVEDTVIEALSHETPGGFMSVMSDYWKGRMVADHCLVKP